MRTVRIVGIILVMSIANTTADLDVPSISRDDDSILLLVYNTPGYYKLLKSIGHDKTIRVVNLIERSKYPRMIKALIGVESSWRPNVVSTAGAVGLMQIMPGTAVEVDSSISKKDLFNPVVNVKIGIAIFENHMSYFEEHVGTNHWALTSYNRGRRGASRVKVCPPVTKYSLAVINSIEYW